MMSWLSAALLCGLVARAAADQERELGMAAHLQLVRALPCSDPQPRALLAAELMDSGAVGTDELLRPPYTVLHRCDAAGCCGDEDQVCAPTRVANVTLWFNVTSLVRVGCWRLAAARARNHTLCACRLRRDLR